jgi:hypothetical protein
VKGIVIRKVRKGDTFSLNSLRFKSVRSYAFNRKQRGLGKWKFPAALVLSISVGTFLISSCTVRTVKRIEPEMPSKAETLFQRLHSYNSAVRSLEAKALAVYRDNERTYSLRVYIAVDKKTERFRFDLSDFVFKVPLTTVLRKVDEVIVVNYSKKTLSSLQYSDLDFSEMLGLKISKEVLVSTVIGEVFTIGNTGITADSEVPTLIINNGEETETVIFSPELIPVQVKYEFQEDSLTMQFSKHEKIENVQFPKKISIQDANRTLDINYSDLRVNMPFEEAVFLLDKEKIADFSSLD